VSHLQGLEADDHSLPKREFLARLFFFSSTSGAHCCSTGFGVSFLLPFSGDFKPLVTCASHNPGMDLCFSIKAGWGAVWSRLGRARKKKKPRGPTQEWLVSKKKNYLRQPEFRGCPPGAGEFWAFASFDGLSLGGPTKDAGNHPAISLGGQAAPVQRGRFLGGSMAGFSGFPRGRS